MHYFKVAKPEFLFTGSSPQSTLVVPGENATFQCNTTPASSGSVWKLQNKHFSPLNITFITRILLQDGPGSDGNTSFFVSAREIDNTYSSVLTIIGSRESNNTLIQCRKLPAIISGSLESLFVDNEVANLHVLRK